MTILTFLVVLAVLVLVHELGHFVAARRNGVKVEEFGLGFPPKLFSFQGKKTLYSINLIPLGGFVKIKGEGGEFKKELDSFANKKAWQRASILIAGVLMNFLIAWILISLGLTLGLPLPIKDTPLPPRAQIKSIGIQIASIIPNSPASKVDLQPGDTIVSINNQSFEEIEDLQKFVTEKDGQALNLVVRRGKELIKLMVTPQILPLVDRYALGVGLVKTGLISLPWYDALYQGLKRTVFITREIVLAFYELLKNLVVGRPLGMELSGPVGIAVITGQVARLGIVYLMQFTAILSVNLAIINFLPFPALDGGRILFLLIEKVRGKPISKNIENALHNLGFIILIALMILVTIRDVGRYSKFFLE